MIREKELHQAEEDELKRAETEMRQKIHADLDLVAKKLNEEVRHKRLLLASEADEKIQVSPSLFHPAMFHYLRFLDDTFTHVPMSVHQSCPQKGD